jgi:hypothetical protein
MAESDASPPGGGGEGPDRLWRWASLAGLAGAFLALLWWSWLGWPDPIIDFGRELYVPWQLSEGRRLYADIAYHNGPFSPYFNAALFALFGDGLQVLALANLAIAAGCLWLLHRLLRECGGRAGAFLGALTAVALCFFLQLTPAGNYNWVSPYSHEMTHGVTLSLLGLFCLGRVERGRGRLWALAGGLALGLVFLAKAEIFVAAAGGMVAGCALPALRGEWSGRDALRVSGWLGSGFSLAVAGAFLLLRRVLAAPDAAAGVFGAWRYVLLPGNVDSLFFRSGMGLVSPAAGLSTMIGMAALYAAILGAGILAARPLRRHPSARRRLIGLGVFLASLLLLGSFREAVPLQSLAAPLPLLLAVMAVWIGRERFAADPDPPERRRLDRLLVLIVFGGLLLGKMLLNARIYQYGFGLALPSTALAVWFLVEKVPVSIRRRGGSAAPYLAVLLGCWCVVVLVHLERTGGMFTAKTCLVGAPGDTFRADPRGCIVADALAAIREGMGPGETLTVLPDGEMLAFLARRRNPVKYGQFNPHQLEIHGEERILAALAAAPPDAIALVSRRFDEYGYGRLGEDFGFGIAAWISDQYTWSYLTGADPRRSDDFGILLLRRNDP